MPYGPGVSSWVGQGNNGLGELCEPCSHYRVYALDFVLPVGTPVVAARSGVVVDVQTDCPDCTCPWGPDPACPDCCGNHIVIEHDDGSRASYWHLMPGGACLSKGRRVQRGDVVGRSGNTGISMLPHLEFKVFAPAGETGSGFFGPSADGSMEVTFADVGGDGVPRFLGNYVSQNAFDPSVNRNWCADGEPATRQRRVGRGREGIAEDAGPSGDSRTNLAGPATRDRPEADDPRWRPGGA